MGQRRQETPCLLVLVLFKLRSYFFLKPAVKSEEQIRTKEINKQDWSVVPTWPNTIKHSWQLIGGKPVRDHVHDRITYFLGLLFWRWRWTSANCNQCHTLCSGVWTSSMLFLVCPSCCHGHNYISTRPWLKDDLIIRWSLKVKGQDYSSLTSLEIF